jgi:hypothetical protein
MPRGLANAAPTRAKTAEPLLRIAVETLGDINPAVCNLYLTATAAAVAGDDPGDLPTDLTEARTYTEAAERRYSYGYSDDERLRTVGSFYDNMYDSERAELAAEHALITLRHNILPRTAITRRRHICSALWTALSIGIRHDGYTDDIPEDDLDLDDPRYQHLLTQYETPQAARTTRTKQNLIELQQTLARLSPDDGLTLLIRERIGTRKGLPTQTVADIVGVSPSLVTKWTQGLPVNPSHHQALARALHVPYPTIRAAATDTANRPFPWDQ